MLDRVSVKFFKLAVGNENIGRETTVDIAARCPVCGDSRKNKRSKRLHLYNKGTIDVDLISCFNGDCPAVNKTVYSFLKDFYPNLIEQYKRENFRKNMSKLANGGSNTDVFKNITTIKEKKVKPVETQDLSPYMLPLDQSPEGVQYLSNRKIPYNDELYGKWFLGTQDLQIGEIVYKITNSVVIPLYYEDEMYGFYSRSIKDKNFITYMDDRNIGFKCFNFFNINKSKPVYLFEGIFDAISSGKTNIVALLGAKFPDARLAELSSPVFVLDNDRTGILNMIGYANKGYSVFVQPSKYKEKDMNELMINHPDLDISKLIDDNTFNGISAVIRLRTRL